MIRKRKNKRNSKMYELNHILDSHYFHISTEYKLDKSIKWAIYYKNLPTNLYFSEKNKALLTSEENCIKDIYKLREVFNREKKVEMSKHIPEYLKLSMNIFKQTQNIKMKFTETLLDILLICLIVSLINLIFIRDIKIGLLNMFLTCFIFILGTIKLKKIDEQLEKDKKEFEENFFREKIKKQGLFFVERLKI